MSQQAVRVRLVQAGRENMTGLVGRHMFQDGVSVNEIPIREALRLGAIMSIVDERGNAIHPSTYVYADANSQPAPLATIPTEPKDPNAPIGGHDVTVENGKVGVKPEELAKKVEQNAPVIVTVQVPAAPNPDGDLAPEVSGIQETAQLRLYTQEELEAVADKQGINGLRAIADPLQVKNRSIPGLIAEIVAAQQKLVVKQ